MTAAQQPAAGRGGPAGRILASVDPYILALLGTVLLASVLPARGVAAQVTDVGSTVAVGLLFFLYGARLETRTALRAMADWRLHLSVLAMTFAVYPVIGWGTATALGPLVGTTLTTGLVFLGTLPSTVNSSVTFTSIARGDVAAAICAASASSVLGVFITPLLCAVLLGSRVVISTGTLVEICLQVLAPFVAGQLLRPLLGDAVASRKRLTNLTDRATILLVVYNAFSAGVVDGLWHRTSPGALAAVLVACCLMLAAGMAAATLGGRLLRLPRESAIVLLFAGSKKSLTTGVPIATVLMPASVVGTVVLPVMLFHQLQLIVCAVLARRFAASAPEGDQAPATA